MPDILASKSLVPTTHHVSKYSIERLTVVAQYAPLYFVPRSEDTAVHLEPGIPRHGGRILRLQLAVGRVQVILSALCIQPQYDQETGHEHESVLRKRNRTLITDLSETWTVIKWNHKSSQNCVFGFPSFNIFFIHIFSNKFDGTYQFCRCRKAYYIQN